MPRTKTIALWLVVGFGFWSWTAPIAQSQSFNFTTLAGNAGYGSQDGLGGNARFHDPQGVAADSSGNLYIADSANSIIRQITPAGLVSTVAGLARSPGTADGTNGSARFNFPQGVALDGLGNLYVTDTRSHTIREIAHQGSNWVVSTLAGQVGQSGTNDGVGTNAQFKLPGGIAVDGSGNLYVADTFNSTIRKIVLTGTNWTVSTISGQAGFPGFINATNLHTQFSFPSGVALDASNNVYVADTDNSAIRKLVLSGTNWLASTLASVNLPGGIALDVSNNVYATAIADGTVMKITSAGVASTFAGIAGSNGFTDGTNVAAQFNNPQGTAVDGSGFVYVADSLNNTIRKITPAGTVSTLAGLAGSLGDADSSNSLARFNAPQGVAVDASGNVYAADTGNNTIRLVKPVGTNWQVNTVAGLAGSPGNVDDIGTNAQFNTPVTLAVDAMTNLYVADSANNEIRKVTNIGTNWMVNTLAGRAGTFFSGNITNELFLTNVVSGVTNIEGFTNVSFVLTNFSVITNFSGAITNVVGNVTNVFFLVTNVPAITNLTGVPPVVTNLTTNFFTLTNIVHSLDGPAAFALFSQPYAVAVGANTNVYVADRANNEIREISSIGLVSTLAGSPLTNGTTDGTGTNALFAHPSGIAEDSVGNLYVTDTDNGTVREMTPAGTNWMVSTIAGLPRFHGITDGTNNGARFDSPRRIAVDNSGTLYVSDGVDNTIRKIKPVGTNWVVTTVGGLAGVSGSSDGTGTNALFFEPEGLAVDSAGNLYIADTQNNTLRFGQRTQAGQPMLQIIRSGNQVIISWPMSAAGFTLQNRSTIFPGAPWNPLPINGMGTSGTNFVMTNSIGSGNAFYRLLGP